jgi:hypothetical protein
MTIHTCKICGYSTSVSTNLKKHINRKTPCNKACLTAPSAPKTAPSAPKTEAKSKNKLIIINKLQCIHCLKIFSRKNNLTKHQVKSCKKINYNEEVEFIYVSNNEEKDLYNKDMLKKLKDELKEELEKLKNKPNIVNHVHLYAVPMDQESIKQMKILDLIYFMEAFNC